MRRIVNAFFSKLDGGKRGCAVFVLCAATAISLPAQTFTTLFSFDGTDGASPFAGLVQATDGNLYGTTTTGGAYIGVFGTLSGTAFKITPSGTLTTLYNFCAIGYCIDGDFPAAGLVQSTNGNLYGTTEFGGAGFEGQFGMIFKISLTGTLTTLYSFGAQTDGTDGVAPIAGLVQAPNGYLYGTTSGFGTGGTVFKITPSGTLTTIYNFCAQSGCADGENPQAALVHAANGDFYGTTLNGGANCAPYGCGTVFKITPSGTLTTLYSFCSQSGCPDGENPQAALVQATNGDFYGTTPGGGNCASCGTVFKITPSGTLTTLHSFDGANGLSPYGALVQATDGNLYGTTAYGGAYGTGETGGTLFKITPGGALTTLYSFCAKTGCTDGETPYTEALVQDTNGNLYGTTAYGGASGLGTVFTLSVGLGPFVKTQTTLGTVGAAVKILGTALTGATSVTFNGTAAVFNVVAPSLITATVPAGATTGTVEVVTPGGTLSSNVPYRVAP
jgi:uncharacterized repeat protein (TIGR03803 family)